VAGEDDPTFSQIFFLVSNRPRPPREDSEEDKECE
jgi:hypothetical protein